MDTHLFTATRRRVRGAHIGATARVHRVLDTVPSVRRTVDDLLRVEFLDRTMVIAAQGLLALVPLVVVLTAFLPSHWTTLGVERFASVTGIGQATSDELVRAVTQAGGGAAAPAQSLDPAQVRAQTGFVGLVITVLSASSFARAVQRMYARIWDVSDLGGMRQRRRCLGWLLGWLVALQAITLVAWIGDRVDVVLLDPGWVLLRMLVAAAVWWWTLHTLLDGRVAWRHLVVPASLSGGLVVAYASGSSVVMPAYASSSAAQFGVLGLVLTVATWLVGFGGVLVVAAVVGRVITEDPFAQRVGRRLLAAVRRRR